MTYRESKAIDGVTIEFIGLPGAGKTTLADGLALQLRGAGFSVTTRSEMNEWISQQSNWKKVILRLRYFVKLLPSLVRTTFFYLSIKPRPFQGKFFARLLRPHKAQIVQDIFVSAVNGRLLLLDQAGLQQIWSLIVFADTLNKPLLEQYASELVQQKTQACLYVYLYVKPELSDMRVAGRSHGDSRFENMESGSRIALFSRSQSILNVLVSCLNNSGEKVITLNASDDIPKNIALLEDAIRQFLLNHK